MELFTRQEAAKKLRIGLRTLDRRLATGDIGHYKLGDGPRPPIRISEEQIAEYLQQDSETYQERQRRARKIVGR